MNTSPLQADLKPFKEISTPLTLILAFACGAIVANLYYTQTLVLLISQDLHLETYLAGLIVTLTQLGYALGLVFLVPLSDRFENRLLICSLLLILSCALLGLLLTDSQLLFLFACFVLGIPAVAVQIIVPLAAHLATEKTRGRVVGNIMSGALFGILSSRPLASWLADLFSWRAVFIFSLGLMLLLCVLLRFLLPQRQQPEHSASYGQLLSSLPQLFKRYAILRQRSFYQAGMFFMFSLFWTSVAFLLTHNYHYSQSQIALFAFAGAAGALCAPIAGRIADRGWTRHATAIAILLVFMAFIIAKTIGVHNIYALVASALLLDAGVCCSMVVGQRAIFDLSVKERGRLNSIYMTAFFISGAAGSGLSAYIYTQGGWNMITNTGLIVAIILTGYFLKKEILKTT